MDYSNILQGESTLNSEHSESFAMKSVETTEINAFRKRLAGQVLLPEGEGRYEETRQIWNAMIDRKPAMIV